MGTIICQTCEKIMAQYEDEKVSTLYGVCPHCRICQQDAKPTIKAEAQA